MTKFVNEDGEIDIDGLIQAQYLSARAGYRMACVEMELHEWDCKNKRDMLIGCSLTGYQDFKNKSNITDTAHKELLEVLRNVAQEAAFDLADELGKNKPLLSTTIKPSGTMSQLFGSVSAGMHYSHSPYFIRRVRISATDPLLKVVRELEYPVFPEVGQDESTANTFVVEFPCKAPNGRTKYDVSAREQIEEYLSMMKYYVDHNASNTIHVRDDEWEEVESLIWEKWDDIVSMSFLSLDDSFYQLMPYEAIDEEDYEQRVAAMKEFDPSLISKYEQVEEEYELEADCEGGVCPIR